MKGAIYIYIYMIMGNAPNILSGQGPPSEAIEIFGNVKLEQGHVELPFGDLDMSWLQLNSTLNLSMADTPLRRGGRRFFLFWFNCP